MKKLPGVILLSWVLFSACGQGGPEPIDFGKDACEHCKMTIMDNKFGAEIVTSKGRVFKFDAAECMVSFMNESSERLSDPDALHYIINVAAPGNLIDAHEAFFLKDEVFRSPMGGNLAAFTSRQLAENNLQTADGQVFSWKELLTDMRR